MGPSEKNTLAGTSIMPEELYEYITGVLDAARRRAYAAINFAMVEAYWEIGRSIVRQQGGAERAEYGEALIDSLAARLTSDYGKGFTRAYLRNMCHWLFQFATHCVAN